MKKTICNHGLFLAICACTLFAWACGSESSTPDDVQVNDVSDADDVATDIEPGDVVPGDTTELGDGTALDPTWTMEACPTGTNTNRKLPWVTEFDIGGDMTPNGWEIILPQFVAGGMWDLAISNMDFGTSTGLYAVFMGEEGDVSRTGLYSECVDTSVCVASGTVTAQWRMQYLHGDLAVPVTLKLVGVTGTDLDGGEVIWSTTVSEDIPYDLFSVEIPQTLVGVNGVRFALVLEFPDESALVTEEWSIDHFVIACGKANQNVKSIVYRCPDSADPCTPANSTIVGIPFDVGQAASATMNGCDHYLVVTCQFDPDASSTVWQNYGFPKTNLDWAPYVHPMFVTSSPAIGNSSGCETLPVAVASVCGTDAVATPGYFYCGLDFYPNCASNSAGVHSLGMVVRDGYDIAHVEYSPLESLTPLEMTVTIPIN
jgi:hypothetical protein